MDGSPSIPAESVAARTSGVPATSPATGAPGTLWSRAPPALTGQLSDPRQSVARLPSSSPLSASRRSGEAHCLMNLLHDLGAEAGQLRELLQVLFLGHGVDLDGEQRRRVDLRRDLGARDICRQTLQVERLRHLPGQPLPAVFVELAGLENLTDDPLGLVAGDLAVGLGDIDHAAEHEFCGRLGRLWGR